MLADWGNILGVVYTFQFEPNLLTVSFKLNLTNIKVTGNGLFLKYLVGNGICLDFIVGGGINEKKECLFSTKTTFAAFYWIFNCGIVLTTYGKEHNE